MSSMQSNIGKGLCVELIMTKSTINFL